MTSGRYINQNAVVVGAASGMGRACAIALAREGAAVVLIDRDLPGLEVTAEQVTAQGAKVLAVSTDITEEGAVQAAFAQAVAEFGCLDVALNAAGIMQTFRVTHEIGLEEWQRILAVNVTGTWLCMREELRHMSARRAGAIVNITSYGGLYALPTLSAYVASKHAVVGLTRNAAVEYAALGVRVNAIAPGGIPTPMLARGFADLDEKAHAAAIDSLVNLHPMRRLGTVEEIADAVLFLGSRHAGFVTGVCLPVDGGWAAS